MALLGFSLVLLHLILGFGFLIYKLSPKGKRVEFESPLQESSDKNKIKNVLKK